MALNHVQGFNFALWLCMLSDRDLYKRVYRLDCNESQTTVVFVSSGWPSPIALNFAT